MSYTPTEWSSGDTITAAKMNKLEQGVANAGGVVVIHETITHDGDRTTHTLDHTAQEIYDLLAAGNMVCMIFISDGTGGDGWGAYYTFVDIYYDDWDSDAYLVNISSYTYIASSLNDYPSYTEGGGPV